MTRNEIFTTPSHPSGTATGRYYGSVEIDAPASKVWRVITDYANFADWNAYTPALTPDKGSGHVVGDIAILAYRPETTGSLTDVPCQIQIYNEDTMTLCWQGQPTNMPQFLLIAEKIQRVTSLGNDKCRYEICEMQSKPMAWTVKWLLGKKLQAMNEGIAASLKRYVEETC